MPDMFGVKPPCHEESFLRSGAFPLFPVTHGINFAQRHNHDYTLPDRLRHSKFLFQPNKIKRQSPRIILTRWCRYINNVGSADTRDRRGFED